MSRERRPTEHVHSLIKQGRLRVIIPIQAGLLIAACAMVWGWLGADHPQAAYGIIGSLVLAEIILVVIFLRQPVESDETVVQLLSDTPQSTILADPAGGTIVIDKRTQVITARNGEVSVPMDSVRTVLVELGEDCRVMLATDNDLVVLSEVRGALDKERAKIEATAQLLARVAALPFDGS